MRFTIEFKHGPETVAKIEGRDVDPNAISVAELNQVIPIEQRLERWTGLRVHIFCHPE
jgi:hypothetical protein